MVPCKLLYAKIKYLSPRAQGSARKYVGCIAVSLAKMMHPKAKTLDNQCMILHKIGVLPYRTIVCFIVFFCK
jgi:hypothetical protein